MELNKLKRARWKGRTDLFWLAREILGYKLIEWDVHYPLINSLQKFPDPLPDEKEKIDRVVNGNFIYNPFQGDHGIWLKQLPGKRRRLILDFRSSFKTTINVICHSIQWILNDPDITILIVHAKQEVAEAILGEIKRHFTHNKVLRSIYPDSCPVNPMDKKFANQQNLWIPNRVNKARKEPTVGIASIDTAVAGLHYDVIKFTDIVDLTNVGTEAQLNKVRQTFGMYRNVLTRPDYWLDVEGTRYHFCLQGTTSILMSDWSHKPISSIRVGDEVVGWGLELGIGTGKRRMLKRSKVIACGSLMAKANRYTMSSGAEIVCTPEHKWWRGKQWKKNEKNQEYSEIKRLSSLRRLMVPCERNYSWESGWVAGMCDGEGTFRKNPNHPSGAIGITQTLHNPELVQQLRENLQRLGFEFSEQWHQPSKTPGLEHYKDRCIFYINGGWKERYRFLAEISPFKRDALAASLFGQLQTDEDKIVRVEEVGEIEVFWFQCETGNYIANGYCSKNSDLYGSIIESEKDQPEEEKRWNIYMRGVYKRDTKGKPYTFTPEENEECDFLKDDNGNYVSWFPDLFPVSEMEAERKDPALGEWLFNTQRLNMPVNTEDAFFPLSHIQWKTKEEMKKVPISYYTTTMDTAETTGDKADFTAITTCGWDGNGRCYVVDIRHGKMHPDEQIRHLFEVFLKYSPTVIRIEETGYVRGLKASIGRQQDIHGVYLPLDFIKRDNQNTKIERILNTLQPIYKRKDIFFSEEITCKDKLIQELTRFPKYKDDILDTLADQFQNRDWFGRNQMRRTPDEIQAETLRRRQEGLPDPLKPKFVNDFYRSTGGL
jgi:predicted phage terminase large subunit-like protein